MGRFNPILRRLAEGLRANTVTRPEFRRNILEGRQSGGWGDPADEAARERMRITSGFTKRSRHEDGRVGWQRPFDDTDPRLPDHIRGYDFIKEELEYDKPMWVKTENGIWDFGKLEEHPYSYNWEPRFVSDNYDYDPDTGESGVYLLDDLDSWLSPETYEYWLKEYGVRPNAPWRGRGAAFNPPRANRRNELSSVGGLAAALAAALSGDDED